MSRKMLSRQLLPHCIDARVEVGLCTAPAMNTAAIPVSAALHVRRDLEHRQLGEPVIKRRLLRLDRPLTARPALRVEGSPHVLATAQAGQDAEDVEL